MAVKYFVVLSCLVYGAVANPGVPYNNGQQYVGGVVGAVESQPGRVISSVGIADQQLVNNRPGQQIVLNKPNNQIVLNQPSHQVVVNQPRHQVVLNQPGRQLLGNQARRQPARLISSGATLSPGQNVADCNAIHCPLSRHNFLATDGRQCFQLNGQCSLNKENCRRRSRNQLSLEPTTAQHCHHLKAQILNPIGVH